MAFTQSSRGAVAEINITPLVDVMLVLLVIFMVTAPTLSQTLTLDLPRPNPNPPPPSDTLSVRVDPAGQVFWDGRAISAASLPGLLQLEAGRNPQPTLEISADDGAHYAAVSAVLAAGQRAGLHKIGLGLE